MRLPLPTGQQRNAAPTTSDRWYVPLVLMGGVALLLIGIVYFSVPAGSLPAFVPGSEAGSTHYHLKHGIAAVLLGAGAFVLVWFRLGPRQRRGD